MDKIWERPMKMLQFTHSNTTHTHKTHNKQTKKNKKTHKSIHATHAHPQEALPIHRLLVLAHPRRAQPMAHRDRFVQAPPYHGPPAPTIVQPEHADELLQVVVEHGVVHARVHVLQRRREDGVGRVDKGVWLEIAWEGAGGRVERGQVDPQPAKVPDYEAQQLWLVRGRGWDGEAGEAVLRVAFKCDAVVDDGWEECGKEDSHEANEESVG